MVDGLSLELLKYSSVALSVGLSALGALIGISWSSKAIAGAGSEKPEVASRNIISVVLAEALAIYGLIVGLLLILKMGSIDSLGKALMAFTAGCIMGFTALISGLGIGSCGRSLALGSARRPEIFSRLVLGVVLCEAIGLYGLVTSLLLVMRI